MTSLAVWTIGHSNHALDHFIALLRRHRMECVVDVRSSPYSRYAPHFNRESIQPATIANGIGYACIGDALGGRPQRADHYDEEGHALYEEMAERPSFVAAIDRLLDGASRYRVAIMCSEADPRDCHRRLLVGKVLVDRGVELRHILRDGTVMTEREIDIGGTGHPRLFGENPTRWRSTRSVSPRPRPSISSSV